MNTIEQYQSDSSNPYRVLGLVAFFFLVFSFFTAKPVPPSELSVMHQATLGSFSYTKSHGKNPSYRIKLWIKGDHRRFEITGMDYDHVDHEAFRRDLTPGDEITLQYSEGEQFNSVRSLIKNEIDYCDLAKANNDRIENSIWIKALSGYTLFICILAMILERKPSPPFGTVLLFGLVLLSFILTKVVGCSAVTGNDFPNEQYVREDNNTY